MEKVAWVVGEVLVDLIPATDGDESIGNQRYRAIIGGGGANTVRALARLGKRCEFIGGLSSDRFGHMAWMELERDGVGLDLSAESDRPTAKAIVALDDDGVATYSFEVEGSATFSFDSTWLPEDAPDLLHIGSLATVVSPGSEALKKWVRDRHRAGTLVVFDPNVRPAFLSDMDQYREIVEEWIALTDLVKASEEEIAWLYPESDQESVASRWMKLGTELIVITRGSRGMVALRSDESIGVEGVEIDLVDTVGAGDTVGAVLVEALMDSGIEALRGERLEEVLRRAALAAAITCSREGANPPSRDELMRWKGNDAVSR
jgi:fructokinase